jgi:hypothetical protein
VTRPRTGLALPAAVVTLGIIALFIAGSAFAASQEARASVGSLAERLALEAAEYGIAATVRDWDRAWNLVTPIGQTTGPVTRSLAGGASVVVRLTRTSLTAWWVVSEGTAGGSALTRGARRTVNAAFRLDLPPDIASAALAATDSVHVAGSVIGTDSTELALTCAGMAPGVIAGVSSGDTLAISSSGTISGTPRLLSDSAIGLLAAAVDSSLVADIVLPPGAVVTPAPIVTAGSCDTIPVTNWGDPAGGACRTRMPVIKATGDVTVDGGVGQGILLAAGDVTFQNGASFAGIVVARDDFVTGAGGGVVLGAVVSADARRGPGDHSVVASGGLIRRSSCRVRQARLAAAPLIRVRARWWAEF